jgi:hypothetical protein
MTSGLIKRPFAVHRLARSRVRLRLLRGGHEQPARAGGAKQTRIRYWNSPENQAPNCNRSGPPELEEHSLPARRANRSRLRGEGSDDGGDEAKTNAVMNNQPGKATRNGQHPSPPDQLHRAGK